MTLFESFAKLSQFIEFRLLYSSKLSRLFTHTQRNRQKTTCIVALLKASAHTHTLLVVVGGFFAVSNGAF